MSYLHESADLIFSMVNSLCELMCRSSSEPRPRCPASGEKHVLLFNIARTSLFYHQDPRDYGSHNAGGTNAGRLWGKKVGLVIIILDMLKTIAPIYAIWAILTFVKFDYHGITEFAAQSMENIKPLMADVKTFYTDMNSTYAIQWPVYWVVALGAMVGHCWPVFAQFKGGKAASMFMGTTVMCSWMLGFLPGFFYLGTLKWKKMVSLSAILQAIFVSTITWAWAILVQVKVIPGEWAWLPMYGPSLNPNWVYATVVTILGAVMVARHHQNIKRIMAGEERKITWMK